MYIYMIYVNDHLLSMYLFAPVADASLVQCVSSVVDASFILCACSVPVSLDGMDVMAQVENQCVLVLSHGS